MPIHVVLEPDDEGYEHFTEDCKITIHRAMTSGGLPAVAIEVPEGGDLVALVTLREFLATARALRAKAEGWPEWQEADTP